MTAMQQQGAAAKAATYALAAAGTAAGLTGFFGYFFGTAILSNIALGYILEHLGWNANFIVLLVGCALAILFTSFTYKEEQYLVKNKTK